MADLVLFGTTSFEKRLKYLIERQGNDRVVAFCVDADYISGSEHCGLPVVPLEDLPLRFASNRVKALVGIGYKDMNRLRMKKSLQLVDMGYDLFNYISENAYIDSTVSYGSGNIVLGNAFIDCEAVIGDGNIIECGVQVSHEAVVGDFNYMSPSSVVGGKTHIGNCCFLGMNCTVRSAVHLEDSCLIGAGAYVDKNVRNNEVIVPARSYRLEKNSDEMNILVQESWYE